MADARVGHTEGERVVPTDTPACECAKRVAVEEFVATLEEVELAIKRAPAGAGTGNE